MCLDDHKNQCSTHTAAQQSRSRATSDTHWLWLVIRLLRSDAALDHAKSSSALNENSERAIQVECGNCRPPDSSDGKRFRNRPNGNGRTNGCVLDCILASTPAFAVVVRSGRLLAGF